MEAEQAAVFDFPYIVLRLKRVSMAVDLQCKAGEFLKQSGVGKCGRQFSPVSFVVIRPIRYSMMTGLPLKREGPLSRKGPFVSGKR